jgi:hypothetical protein
MFVLDFNAAQRIFPNSPTCDSADKKLSNSTLYGASSSSSGETLGMNVNFAQRAEIFVDNLTNNTHTVGL